MLLRFDFGSIFAYPLKGALSELYYVARLNFKTSCVGVYNNAFHLLLALPSLSQFGQGGCLLSRFHFMHCRYFLGHVTCQNLPWQGLLYNKEVK